MDAMTGSVFAPRPTDRQLAVLSHIADVIDVRDHSPLIRSIADHFGWASTNAVVCHIARLERHGFLQREPAAWRGLRVTDDGYAAIERWEATR